MLPFDKIVQFSDYVILSIIFVSDEVLEGRILINPLSGTGWEISLNASML